MNSVSLWVLLMHKCCIRLYFFSSFFRGLFYLSRKTSKLFALSIVQFPLGPMGPWNMLTSFCFIIVLQKSKILIFLYWICLLVICKNFHLSAFWSKDRRKGWHWSSFYYCVWRSPSMSLTSEKKNLYVTISLQKETVFVVTLNSSKGSDTFFADWPSRSKNTLLCWRSIF